MKKNYIINESTHYLEQIEDNVIVNELGKEVILNDIKMKRILEESCSFYGCSYVGRKSGSQNLLNENYKLPIIIKENKLLVIFPMNSLRNNKNIWIVYNNIKNYIQISKCKILIEFKNGDQKTIHASYYRFHKQILKSSRLIVIYNSRNQ